MNKNSSVVFNKLYVKSVPSMGSLVKGLQPRTHRYAFALISNWYFHVLWKVLHTPFVSAHDCFQH